MTLIGKSLLGVAAGAGLLALSSVGASAAIACSGNVCWHTHEHFDYPARSRVIIHEDGWRPGPRVIFHEHEGRGYWNGDRWSEW